MPSSRSSLQIRRRGAGFTLIELMVTMVLLAVMLTLAAPSFITFQRNSELTATANSFVAALSAARSEAMKRQLDTYVIPGGGTEFWTNGWVVYVDTNNNQTFDAATDLLIVKQDALPSAMTATGMADGTSHYVRFSGSGFMSKIDGSFGLTNAIDFSNGGKTRRVIASPSGRFRVCDPVADTVSCNTTTF